MSYSKESILFKNDYNPFLVVVFLTFFCFPNHFFGQYSKAWKVEMDPDYKFSFHNFLEEDYNKFTLLVHNLDKSILYQHYINSENTERYAIQFPQDFFPIQIDSTIINLPNELFFTILDKKDTVFQKRFIFEPSINALLQLKRHTNFSSLPEDVWGTVLDGYQWLDRKGNNVVTRSFIDHDFQSDSGIITKRYLYLYHFREDENENYQLLRKFTDSYEYCNKNDVATKFNIPSIELTDVNRDTIGEISTFYKLSCNDNDSVSYTGKLLFTTDRMKFMLESYIDPCEWGLPLITPSSGLELHPYFQRFMRNKFLDNL